MTFRVRWHDSGREPRSKPNPAHPNGVDADLSGGAAATCSLKLDYPARRCGAYTAADRRHADDRRHGDVADVHLAYPR